MNTAMNLIDSSRVIVFGYDCWNVSEEQERWWPTEKSKMPPSVFCWNYDPWVTDGNIMTHSRTDYDSYESIDYVVGAKTVS
jgi:hypothetical protein